MSRFQIGNYWLSQRRNSDAWCRTWYDQRTRQTRRSSLGTDDLPTAQVRLAEWVTLHAEIRADDSLPFPTLAVRYYHDHARHLPSAEAARYALGYWTDFFPGPVHEIHGRADAFRDHLLSRHSVGYARRILTIGRAALHWGHRERLFTGDIPSVRLPPKPTREELDLPRFTPTESQNVLRAAQEAPERHWRFILLAFTTLARPAALLDLHADQVDRDHRIVRLNPPGRRQTKKRRPTVPMCDYLHQRCEGWEGRVIQYQGGAVKSVRKGVSRIMAAAGVPWASAYTIRRTMAMELRRAGVPHWEVEGMLGHTLPSTSEDYAEFAPDYLGAAAQAIDAYLGVQQR